MPELSIIVPVYKVEQYLPKCIDSILAQTFSDFELILIDDGSPDRCGRICDEYAAKDSRITVIHQENKGASAARNAGLDLARGEYIGFVDSDDWIEPEMYETMLGKAKEADLDLVICGLNNFSESGEHVRSILLGSGAYSKNELLKSVFRTPNELGGGCVNKVFRHAAIQSARFREGVPIAEDWLYLFACYTFCSSAYKLSAPLYNIVERQNSATRENELAALNDILFGGKASLILLQSARRYSRDLERAALNKYLDDCIRFAHIVRKRSSEKKQPFRKTLFKIKLLIIRQLPRAIIMRLLSRQQIHRFISEMVKL